MKVTVKVDNQVFEVEVGDLTARPITATVDGQRFEVWPEETAAPAKAAPAARKQTGRIPSTPSVLPHPEVSNPPTAASAVPRTSAAAAAAPTGPAANAVHAPIPGVIVSVAAAAGSRVEVGQELCVLEAMKMKNVIRAPRAGEISVVHIAAGQHVKHRDLLFEYAD
ncbi:biotin/lipoyl-containing protein [Aggregatilinea lenta]|uniref:biotin/lipoyl-containing protein n=1 Tax=Aggregatilinea lenta TaxID=913108 RepID=UPI000E5AFF9F|nr:acetyl-CoA carboxylase biotin carboxyl carrier protein subunit [Aggregatilinea lenta]